MRPRQIQIVLDNELQASQCGEHTPVMFWGPPGVGKSELVREAGRRNGVPVVDIRLSQMEPSDLRGFPFKKKGVVEWAPPGMLPTLTKDGAAGYLFLDELTAAVPSVSAAAYQLILDRCLGDYKVPDGWAILAAGNRQGDRGISYTMPSPLANRFCHFDFEANLEDWVDWAYHNQIDERIISFLRFRPDKLFEFNPDQNPTAFPSPRSWAFCHRALQKYRQHEGVLSAAVQGCIGKAVAAELLAYIRVVQDLPNIDDIFSGARPTPPSAIDLQYAVATAIVGRVARNDEFSQELSTHVLEYALLFPQQEIGVMVVSDLMRIQGDQILELAAFAPWAESVSDIMLYE